MPSEEQQVLVKSILSKSKESSYSEVSINKFFKKVLNLIDPVISNQRFWQILNEFGKGIKSSLTEPSEVSSTDILGLYEADKQAETGYRSSSSIFVESFSAPTTLSSIQKIVERNNNLFIEPTSTPTTLKGNQGPTSDLFSADYQTGEICDINIAFQQFKQRMVEIASQYNGEIQKYFLNSLINVRLTDFQSCQQKEVY